jgi:hypothetical protein
MSNQETEDKAKKKILLIHVLLWLINHSPKLQKKKPHQTSQKEI